MSKRDLPSILSQAQRSFQSVVSGLVPVWIHALAAGRHTSTSGPVEISSADIQRIADSYQPEVHEAPAVVGHPATDDPAYGWISKAEARTDGLWLLAELLPEMADSVRRKLYKKVSVSLYPPDHPANPWPGGLALKHLGFLGAQPPAVKGLKPIALNEVSDVISIEFCEKESPHMDEEELKAKAQAIALAETQLAEEKAAMAAEKAELENRKKALRRQELDSMLQKYVAAGQVLPRQQPVLLALAETLDATTETITLSEGGEKAPMLKAFEGFLAELPAQIDLKEHTAPAAGVPPTQDFAAPAGYQVDQADAQLFRQVEEYRRAHPEVTIVEAIKAVKGATV